MKHVQKIESKYFELTPIADSVFAAIVNNGTGAVGNAGIIDLGDETVVFDTMYTPQAAEDLRKAAEELFGRPVSYVINSHFHFDHIGGNQVFSQAAIISTAKTRELMLLRGNQLIGYAKSHPEYPEQVRTSLESESDVNRQKEIANHLGDVLALAADLPAIKLTPPTLLFEQSLTLLGSKRHAVLLAKGSGHTPCDSILYLPDDEVVFMGDLLTVNNHPNIRDGNAREWVRILDEIHPLPIRVAVPGHGPVGGKDEITALHDYLVKLLELAAELAAAKTPLEIISKEEVPRMYAEWQFPSLYANNLKHLCEQLSQP
jgi:cyclase